MKTRIVLLAAMAIGCGDGRMTLGEAAREIADCHAAMEAIEHEIEAADLKQTETGIAIANLYRETRENALSKLHLRISALTIAIETGKPPL